MARKTTAILGREESIDFDGYELKIKDMEHVSEESKEIYILEFEIRDQNNEIELGHTKWIYYSDWDQVLINAYIQNMIMEDLYVSIKDLDPDGNNIIDVIEIEIMINPLINIIWFGFGLMVLGMVIRMGIESFENKNKNKMLRFNTRLN